MNGLIFEWKERTNYAHYRTRINLSNFKEKMTTIETLFKEAGGFKEEIKAA